MRISYSIAHEWWSGNQDNAIAMLSSEPVYHPLALEKAFSFGQGVHKAMELEAQATGKLPAIFKLPDFDVIATEQKLTKELPSGDVLSGILDVVAINPKNGMIMLGDYKSSNSFDELQACVYQYLITDHPWWKEHIGDLKPTHAFFMTLDKKADFKAQNHIIHLTHPKTPEEWAAPDATTYTRGGNWIMTCITEIKEVLEIA